MDTLSNPDRLHVFSYLKKWIFSFCIPGLIDIIAIAVGIQCSYLINYSGNNGFFFDEKYLLSLSLGILPFWLLILYLIKIAGIPTKQYMALFLIYLQSAILILFLLILLCFFLNLSHVSLLFLTGLSIGGFFFLFIVRILKYKVFKNYGIHGYNHLNIIIIADDSSLLFIENLLSKKGLGYKIVVIFTESALIKEKYEKMTIILPEKYLGILNDLIEVDLIDEVLYLKNSLVPSEVRETVKSCEELGVTLRLGYNDPKISLSSAVMTDIANRKFLSFINIPHSSIALAIKKTTDINLSVSLIVILFPVFILISVLIKLTSKGPVICKQEMPGLRGHQFTRYKFRTRIINADRSETDPGSEIPEDSTVTKIGRFLQKSGLDELPHLFNVLKGDITMFDSSHHIKNFIPEHPKC